VFGIEWSEYAVIAIVALIVIGPKELPAVLRTIGQWTTKIRRMAAEFQSQFQEALREAEMADLKKEVDNLNDVAKGFSQFDDPLKEATKWEANPDGLAKSAEASSAEASSAEASSGEAPRESAPVAPVPPAEPPSQAGEGKSVHPPLPASDGTVGEESFPISVDQSTIEQTPAAASPAGKGENGGGAAEAPAAPPLAQPPLSQDSGQKGSEGGVRS
jgi:sec-independent protein translocase protein TatB